MFDGFGHFSVGADGTLVYAPPPESDARRSLVWVDREGNEELLAAEVGAYSAPRLSPDGRLLAVEVGVSFAALALTGDNPDIWLYDFLSETLTRFTFDEAEDRAPLWTANGERIVFGSTRDGDVQNLFWRSVDGSGQVERLTNGAKMHTPHSISPNGQELLFVQGAAGLHTLSMEGDRQAKLLLRSAGDATVSPDGRWLAYVSRESGGTEVWVRPFPNVEDGRWPISNGPGESPVWNPGGGELFYLARCGYSLYSSPYYRLWWRFFFRPRIPLTIAA